jgi:hypothetical protein
VLEEEVWMLLGHIYLDQVHGKEGKLDVVVCIHMKVLIFDIHHKLDQIHL